MKLRENIAIQGLTVWISSGNDPSRHLLPWFPQGEKEESMQELASDATAWKSSMIIVNVCVCVCVCVFYIQIQLRGGRCLCVQGVEWTLPL